MIPQYQLFSKTIFLLKRETSFAYLFRPNFYVVKRGMSVWVSLVLKDVDISAKAAITGHTRFIFLSKAITKILIGI